MSDALQRLAALLPPDRLLTRPEHLAAYESDGFTAFRTTPLTVLSRRPRMKSSPWSGAPKRNASPLSRAAAAPASRAARCRLRTASSSRSTA